MDGEIPLKQAAEQYGLKIDRLRKAAAEGRLDARFLGHQYVVRPSEVERYLREGGRRTQISQRTTRQGAGMARIIAVAVPKGGTGKTTTTLNLGAALAEQGQRVLLVDFDPQGSLTQALGLRPDDLEHTIYSAMKYYLATFEPQLELAIHKTAVGVDLVPADVRLNLANGELTLAMSGEQILRKLLTSVAEQYDVILIDTLPYLGILVVNALVAAQEVLIPLEAEYLATKSVALMLDQIQLMRRSGLNPQLQVCGILLTMVDRTIITRETIEYAQRSFGVHVPIFDTLVKRSVRFPESQASHLSILHYDTNSEGARAYRALAQEVIHGAS